MDTDCRSRDVRLCLIQLPRFQVSMSRPRSSDAMITLITWSGHFIVGGGWKLKYRLEPVLITQRLENNAPAMDTHLFIGPEQVDTQATMNNNALVMVK